MGTLEYLLEQASIYGIDTSFFEHPIVKIEHVVIANPYANIRELPSIESKIVGTANNGTRVFVNYTNEDWSNIGENKWIYSPLLRRV